MKKINSSVPKFKKWFVIFVLVWVVLGTIIVAIPIALGRGGFWSRAQFTEFFVCRGPESGTGLPQEPITDVSPNARTLYVCGYLEADWIVPLHFLLFYDNKATKWFDPEEVYQTGYVYKEVPQAWRQKPGNYRVEVRLARRLIASTEFVVEP